MLLSYEPYELRMFPLFVYYIILIILASILTAKIFFKWKERQVKPPLYLFIVFLLMTASIASLTIGLSEVIITGWKKEIYRLSLPLGYSLFIVSNWFLYLFISHMISKEPKKSLIPLIVIGVVIIISVFLPWNYYGQPPEDYAGKINIRLYTTVSFVLYSFIFYLIIAMICRKTKKATEDKKVRAGFLLLFLSALSMICFFIFLVIENLMIVLFDDPGFSIYFFIAWAFTFLFFVFSYLSLVMPNWLIKLIEKK